MADKFVSKYTSDEIEEILDKANNLQNYSTDYSTEEQVIGSWIDGKPVYSKIVSINLNFNGESWKDTGYTDATIDIIIDSKLYGTDVAYPNRIFKIPCAGCDTNSNGKVYAWCYNHVTITYMYLEYTKTTD